MQTRNVLNSQHVSFPAAHTVAPHPKTIGFDEGGGVELAAGVDALDGAAGALAVGCGATWGVAGTAEASGGDTSTGRVEQPTSITSADIRMSFIT